MVQEAGAVHGLGDVIRTEQVGDALVVETNVDSLAGLQQLVADLWHQLVYV